MIRTTVVGAVIGSLFTLGASAQTGAMHGDRMGMVGRGVMGRLSPEDRSAMVDAHIAAIHAGLKLSADQEKLWPPLEDVMRTFAQVHLSHMQAMRQSRGMMTDDPVGMLRTMADRMSQGAEAARKLADAAAPLYATLDEAQKRRLVVLVSMRPSRMMGLRGMGMMRRGSEDRDDNDDDDDER